MLRSAHDSTVALLRDIDPLTLTAVSAAGGCALCYLYILNQTEKSLTTRAKESFFNAVRRIPFVRRKIEAEVKNVKKDLMHSIHGDSKRATYIDELPEYGIDMDKLVTMNHKYNEADDIPQYLAGRVSGAVFNNESNKAEIKLYQEVTAQYAWSNPLWPKLFPGIRKMEAEVVRMCCTMLGGDDDSCGTMSTGGTSSILLACLAHRNRAMDQGVNFPEMVVPCSAHAAFFKAGELFRIRVVRIPVDPVTFKVDLHKMERAISRNTCMLAGSAPNFPYGTVDDIEKIGQMGIRYGIPVHVDACCGGFLLPFTNTQIGFDFRVAGVTSISADTHKYGLTPKGSSVVLYRNEDYRKHQFYGEVDWQGGIYASSTMEGSRSGLNIALCWSSLLFHGKRYFMDHAEQIRETTIRIRDGIAAIPELRLQGNPEVCIVSWTSDEVDIFRFHDLMGKKGWQLATLQFPNGVHLMVTQLHTRPGLVELFLEDVQLVVDYLKATPDEPPSGSAALYGMVQKIPDRSLVREFACAYLDVIYSFPEE